MVTDIKFMSVILFQRVNEMKALEDKIISEGKVLPGNILKVGSFLNHQLDVNFLLEMGKEIARLFENCGVTKILTIETSGIPIAFAAAANMNIPVVFAKKNKTSNVCGDVFSTVVHSYTHGTDYTVIVSREYITENDKILIVDDFLANGKALLGLIDIVGQAGAEVSGAAIAIEKAFQHGGDEIRSKGIRVESLAVIDSMSDDGLTFKRS